MNVQIDDTSGCEEDVATPRRRRERPGPAEIAAAFAKSFLEKGYQGTSVESVARELDIPKGSVFYHIGTKEEVFFRVQMEGMEEFTASLRAIVQSSASPPERLREAIRDNIRRVDPAAGPLFNLTRDSHFLEKDHAREIEVVRDEYLSLFTSILDDGMEAGDFAPQPDTAKKVVIFGLLRMIGLVRDWYRPGGDLSLSEVADIYWAFTCRGLGFEPPALPSDESTS